MMKEQPEVQIVSHSQIQLPYSNPFHVFESCLLISIKSRNQNKAKNPKETGSNFAEWLTTEI